jgi:hypothetical protein
MWDAARTTLVSCELQHTFLIAQMIIERVASGGFRTGRTFHSSILTTKLHTGFIPIVREHVQEEERRSWSYLPSKI